MAALKYSRQREAIKDFLAHSHEHLTADIVYMNLRESFPNISLGTVYRNLSLLSEMGQIQKISMKDGADRFDGTVSPHDHFICESCNYIEDIFLDDKEEITQSAQQRFDGKIRTHTTIFYGLCRKCMDGIPDSH